jgi:F0F1-type ATP synthase membrane subunit c/vacuolar-type H+-ATPase subunit K
MWYLEFLSCSSNLRSLHLSVVSGSIPFTFKFVLSTYSILHSSNSSKYNRLWHLTLTWQYGSWCLCYFSVIFCEAVAIYGVIVAIILQTKLESVPKSSIYEPESLRAGYAIFASGLIVGFANLVCGCVFFFTCIFTSSQEFSWRM